MDIVECFTMKLMLLCLWLSRHGWIGFAEFGKLKGDKCRATALAASDQFDVIGTTGLQGDTTCSWALEVIHTA